MAEVDPISAVFDPDIVDEVEPEEATTEEPSSEEEAAEPEEKPEEAPAEETEEAEEAPAEEPPAETPEGEEPTEEETKEPEEGEPERYTVKVDGVEQDLTIEELQQGYSLAETSRKRLQEAAEFTRSAKQVIQMVMKDPISASIQLNTGAFQGDRAKAEQHVYEVASKWVADRLKEELLPEGEREIVRRERLLRAEEARIQSERQRLDRERATAQQAILAKQVDKQIAEAVSKAGLRAEPQVFDMMLRELFRHADAGDDLTPEVAAQIVKEKLSRDRGYVLKHMTPEDLEKANPELLKALRVREQKLAQQKARSSNRADGARANRASNPRRRRDGAQESWHDVFDPDR